MRVQIIDGILEVKAENDEEAYELMEWVQSNVIVNERSEVVGFSDFEILYSAHYSHTEH